MVKGSNYVDIYPKPKDMLAIWGKEITDKNIMNFIGPAGKEAYMSGGLGLGWGVAESMARCLGLPCEVVKGRNQVLVASAGLLGAPIGSKE